MKVGIIGAGITGLTSAYDLSKAGHNVVVFESSNQLGGHASTFEVQGAPLERGYHHWFTSDDDILTLMEEVGLGEEVIWNKSSVGTFYNGHTYEFSTPFDILKYKPLTIRERILLGLSATKIRNIQDWKSVEHFTAVEWLKKNIDINAYKHFWYPMLQGKFGRQNYEDVGMAWLWGKMNTRFTSRKNILSKETLGYPKGSFKRLFDQLAEKSKINGTEIRLNTFVNEIHASDQSVYGISTNNGSEIELFDSIICTTPSHIFKNLVKNIGHDFSDSLHKVKYMAALLLILVLDKSFMKYYWLNVADTAIPFVGIIEHTNLVPALNYKGKTVLYISNYINSDNPMYAACKTELIDKYIPHLMKINDRFNESWITDAFHQKVPDAQPIIEKNYSSKLAPHKTAIKNLYLANTSQIYPEDRGTNYGVRMSRLVTKMLLQKNDF